MTNSCSFRIQNYQLAHSGVIINFDVALREVEVRKTQKVFFPQLVCLCIQTRLYTATTRLYTNKVTWLSWTKNKYWQNTTMTVSTKTRTIRIDTSELVLTIQLCYDYSYSRKRQFCVPQPNVGNLTKRGRIIVANSMLRHYSMCLYLYLPTQY